MSSGSRRGESRARLERWPWALRVLLAGCVLLPLLTSLVWGERSWRMEVARATEEARSSADIAREYAVGMIRRHQALLDAVALVADLADAPGADRDELHRRLATLRERHAPLISLGIIDADGRIVLTSNTHPILVDVSDRDYFRHARDRGGLQVERLTIRPNGQDVLILAQPRLGEAFTGIVATTIPIAAFAEAFRQLAPVDRGSASLIQADGLILLRHPPEAAPFRIAPGEPFLRATATADRGTFRAVARTDGVERIYGFARLPDLPLYATFGLSTDSIAAAWRRQMAPVAALLALSALLGCAAVLQTARALQTAVDRGELEAASRRAEVQETLLRELHHRVKNNLMTVQSLVRLRGGTPDGDRVLQQRVMALAQVHDMLHVSEFASRLDVAAFLRALLANTAIVPPERGISVSCEADPVEVEVEAAVPLALTVVELVTNALKHAFPDGRRGSVAVTLRNLGDEAVLEVTDDGVGLPEADARRRTSGLRLVDRLAAQLDGRLEIGAAHGTRFALTFPIAGQGPVQSPAEPERAEAA